MKRRLLVLALTPLVALGLLLPLARGRAAGADQPFSEQQRRHWAFQKITRPAVPAVARTRWVRTPVDAFVLAQLESKGVAPSPRADKITLLRRASFDLIGLPPTPEEVDAFVADSSPGAFDKVIDWLLASPHYGERWARHWLDLARYAESEGFKADETRPNVWRYRDYVIESLNADKPYDRFVREQIAGDELWPDDPAARVATAFNRHYPDESNARNLMQRRQEILNDITDTAGSVFLGVTYGCARCHDHKFDPVLQADYYRLQAFFANTGAADDLVLAPRDAVERHGKHLAVWAETTRALRDEIAALEGPRRKEIEADYFDKYPDEIRAAISKPTAERTPIEWQMSYKARAYLDPRSDAYIATSDVVGKSLKGEAKRRWQELKTELDRFAPLHPGDLPLGSGIIDINRTAPKTFVLAHGAYDATQQEVQPGFLTLFDPGPAAITPPAGVESTGRRTALANWLVDPSNPLPSRVIVNRVWQYHFGTGLVETSSNFGLSGEAPSHPKLLDWLASEFVSNGWSLKKLHRMILKSNTYQQTSRHRATAARIDPANRLLWRFPRGRLEGEVVRDAALSVAGLLNTKMGGPSVFPELPPGMVSRGGWKVSQDSAERNRRSVYVFVRRNTRYPLFETFNMPDTHESCARRDVTTSPQQALTMMNSRLSLEWAQGLAARVLNAAGRDQTEQVRRAYRIAYSRLPDAGELLLAQEFLKRQRGIIAERAARGEKLALPAGTNTALDLIDAAVLVDFCHMLINSNEFVYRI